MEKPNKDLSKAIKKTFGTVLGTTLVIFAANWAINWCGDTAHPLAEAFSTTATYFSGLAALGAAYIATRLFNDWKEQHNKTILALEAKEVFRKLADIKLDLARYEVFINDNKSDKSVFGIMAIQQAADDYIFTKTADFLLLLNNFTVLSGDINLDDLVDKFIKQNISHSAFIANLTSKDSPATFDGQIYSYINETNSIIRKANDQLLVYILIK